MAWRFDPNEMAGWLLNCTNVEYLRDLYAAVKARIGALGANPDVVSAPQPLTQTTPAGQPLAQAANVSPFASPGVSPQQAPLENQGPSAAPHQVRSNYEAGNEQRAAMAAPHAAGAVHDNLSGRGETATHQGKARARKAKAAKAVKA